MSCAHTHLVTCRECAPGLPPDIQRLIEQGHYIGRIESSLAHIHAKLDRLLALAGDQPKAAMIDEAIRRAATREAKCQHEPSGLPNYCRKCGCQIQAPLVGQGML